jgi:UDP-MurNAc hydroxylase
MTSGFKVLGHASMIVEHAGKKLLVDPWLLGSCYWRSWWNFPQIKPGTINSVLDVDYIYITHIHWDHWHGPTLKKFSRDIPIITHDEPNSRSADDLRKIGFKNIILLKHGEQFKIADDFKIIPYQFGLFLNDSALVVETSNFKLLNANDCKIAGMPLRDIANRHGHFDFVFRSHSSANDRICHKIEGVDNTEMDDNDHYARSFKIFMEILKPTYAIPFASNHCHLHRDVFDMNAYINDPLVIKDKIEKMGGLPETTFKIMLSGDTWDHTGGFQIDEDNIQHFVNKDIYLKKYVEDVADKLNAYYEREERIKINDKTFEKFLSYFHQLPFWVLNKHKNLSFVLELRWHTTKKCYIVSPFKQTITPCETGCEYAIVISMPAIIFRDAIYQNMFHHSGISKRNRYFYKTEKDFNQFNSLMKSLELIEFGFYPLNGKYITRTIMTYTRRWKELFVYVNAFWQKVVLRKKIYHIEEAILSNT